MGLTFNLNRRKTRQRKEDGKIPIAAARFIKKYLLCFIILYHVKNFQQIILNMDYERSETKKSRK